MNEAGQLDRKELATAAGMKPGTFWRLLLEHNDCQRRAGLPELKPDAIQNSGASSQHRNSPKFFFNPERVAEFKAALDKPGRRGRPKPQLDPQQTPLNGETQ